MSHGHGHGHGHPRRPNIGVTPDLGATRSEPPLPLYELKAAYADAVFRAGGLPLVLPYSEDLSCVELFLDRISGLLVTGGAFDIPPEAYGESATPGMGQVKPARTTFETALLRGALHRNLPVLGVCGGMQLLNVVLGGSLIQDIRTELPAAKEHEQQHDRKRPQHPVDVKDGTLLAEAMGKGQVMANSTHHQAVKKPGTNVLISALAPDGVIEAIESTAHTFAVGVQWHPELLVESIPAHLALYRAFISRAREMRK